jgi:hypothetical protein
VHISVYFEVALENGQLGYTRAQHRVIANERLLAAIQADAQFAAIMEKAAPGITNSLKTAGKVPTDVYHWHHALAAQADGRIGILQLVEKSQHTDLYRLMHPNGFGGYAEWVVPNRKLK